MATDRRIQRTRDRLRQALADLILQRSYESITIRDITARADSGYATFFRHYRTKDALLLDLLNRSIEELARLLPPDDQADPVEEGRIIFAHAADNSQLYLILLRGEGTSSLMAQIGATAETEVLHRLGGRSDPMVPSDILAHHLVTSIMTLIGWWLQHGRPYPPERMAHIYAKMIMQPFRDLSGARS